MYENNFLVVILYFINVMFLIMWLFYYMMSFFLVMCLYCMLFYLFIVGFMYMGIIVSFIILFFWLIDYYVWFFLKYVVCDWFKKVKYIFLNNVLFMLLEVWKKKFVIWIVNYIRDFLSIIIEIFLFGDYINMLYFKCII